MSSFSERGSRISKLNAEILPIRLQRGSEFTPFKWDTLFRNEAIECFQRHLPISCVVVSSALVETALIWELYQRKRGKEKKTDPNKFRGNYDLGALFKEFIVSDVPLEKLLDADEHLETLRKDFEQIPYVKYVSTRNSFAHGNIIFPATHLSPLIPLNGHKFDRGDFFYPRTYLSHLLPFNSQELIAYGIKGKEPVFETIAYVHLSKTLRFMKAFADLLIHKHGAKF